MKKSKKIKYSFNDEYLKSVKRDVFVKKNAHLEAMGIDVGGEWDKANKAKVKKVDPPPIEIDKDQV